MAEEMMARIRGGLGALGDMFNPGEQRERMAQSDEQPDIAENMFGDGIQILTHDMTPKIIGEGEQGGERIFLIEVGGNTTMISEDDFYEKFGEPRAQGGRIGYQTGGTTIDQKLQPDYIEALGKT